MVDGASMKDGIYDFCFSALNRRHHGSIEVRDNVAEGGDPVHAVRGQVSRAGTNLVASFEVSRRGDASLSAYQLKMSGTGTQTEFNVIGLGPLGLIVECHGTWRAAADTGAAASPSATTPSSAIATRRPTRR